jgi:hypothetical protein
MVIIENLVIIALVGLALGYLIKMVYNQFTSTSEGGAGCASCSGGCSTNNAFNDMPEIIKSQK